ncbi:uncharacterized protein TNCV_3658351 [Trichonephila clavipes]|nr:uncharacterized protein TNCV_3658351 [Trichonephila clavipes]
MHKEEKCFVKERKKEKLAASPVEKVTKKKIKKKNNPKKSFLLIKCYCGISIRVHERISSTEKTLQNTFLMLSLRDGNDIETLLMTAQINTDFVNHPVPLATEPSTILVHVGTDACKSIINYILRYKDYDSHKNAHKDFEKRFIDNRSIYDRLWFRDDLRTSVAEHKNILPGINLTDTLKHVTIADKV